MEKLSIRDTYGTLYLPIHRQKIVQGIISDPQVQILTLVLFQFRAIYASSFALTEKVQLDDLRAAYLSQEEYIQ